MAPVTTSRTALLHRERFFRAIAPESSFHLLFEHLPGISFFAKDRDSRLVAASHSFYTRFGFSTEAEMVGKSDDDLFPPRLAEHFRSDDLEVMESGQPKIGIVELFFNTQGLPDWFITDKLPVFGRRGEIIGVMGTTRSHSGGRQVIESQLSIDRAVNFIRSHFREHFTVETLAQTAGISTRQLHRKFVEAFGHSPQEFIMKTRIHAACELLGSTREAMSEIARQCGFADQSSFTQHFRRHTGATPRHWQRLYGRKS